MGKTKLINSLLITLTNSIKQSLRHVTLSDSRYIPITDALVTFGEIHRIVYVATKTLESCCN